MQKFSATDIAVVKTACVLPQASSPAQFWQRISQGSSLAAPVSAKRLDRLWCKPQRDPEKDYCYADLACEIKSDQLDTLFLKHGLDPARHSRLYVYLFDAISQIIFGQKKIPQKTDFILGCMNPDPAHVSGLVLAQAANYKNWALALLKNISKQQEQQFSDALKQTLISKNSAYNSRGHSFFTSALLKDLTVQFGLKGEHFLVDAACASSLAAIYLAVNRLRLRQADMIIAGGAESNLGLESFVIFSKVGALADKQSLPFDKNTQGIVQGEGAVLFALKRLEDVGDDEVLAVIRAIDGNSDGKSTSLFEPSRAGQVRLYQKVYSQEPGNLSYLEAHGTGTAVGDHTESEGIWDYFGNSVFPFGSAKAQFGHTKSAAGAVGLLKAILIIQHRLVPASSYAIESIAPKGRGAFLNTKIEELPHDKPVRIGINSFGFGGSNYHLLAEQFMPEAQLQKSPQQPSIELVKLTEARLSLDSFERKQFSQFNLPFRLPPKSIDAIDKVQLLALAVAQTCIQKLGPLWRFVPTERVSVVAACSLYLDQIFETVSSLLFEEIAMRLDKQHEELAQQIRSRIRTQFPIITEDSATGILNNVIAGRVTNIFDFKGKSYCVDKDVASWPVSLQCIESDLILNPKQIFFLIGVEEKPIDQNQKPERISVHCSVISSLIYANELELPAQSIIEVKGLLNE